MFILVFMTGYFTLYHFTHCLYDVSELLKQWASVHWFTVSDSLYQRWVENHLSSWTWWNKSCRTSLTRTEAGVFLKCSLIVVVSSWCLCTAPRVSDSVWNESFEVIHQMIRRRCSGFVGFWSKRVTNRRLMCVCQRYGWSCGVMFINNLSVLQKSWISESLVCQAEHQDSCWLFSCWQSVSLVFTLPGCSDPLCVCRR